MLIGEAKAMEALEQVGALWKEESVAYGFYGSEYEGKRPKNTFDAF